jgi:phenylalanyl-tRNA synthetase beta chain
MKFPYSMLLDFVKTDLNADQAGDLLTMAGFELEDIEEVKGESVLNIKVMSNRGDGLSVCGLAREVLAKDEDVQQTDLYRRAVQRFGAAHGGANGFPVTIETDACARYACRVFTDLTRNPTPPWIQGRLEKAGMRPISLLVDLTNYVMLEMGQPLHAFDLDKLKGGQIIVRQARPAEKLKTLDDVERQLSEFMMVIADAERPVAIAGVMGGLETEVTASTKCMLLESANFLNTSVRKTRRSLGMSTEASYRFERSVDPDGVVAAINRFTELFVQSGGGTANEDVVDVYPRPLAQQSIRVRLGRSELLLGMPITNDQATRYLTRLGFAVTSASESSLEVTAPSWRPDIVREEDVIEELGRIHGYERIPERLPRGTTLLGGTSGYEAWEDRIRETVLRLGFTQTISHTLRDVSPLDDPNLDRIGPRGISDPEMMWLRSSSLTSLADASKRNGGKDLSLFELGQVFGSRGGKLVERTTLALLSQGSLMPEWWQGKVSNTTSFFTLKGAVQRLLSQRLEGLAFQASGADGRLHPTRQTEIHAAKGVIGLLGQIDPDVAEITGLPSDTILAEIDLTAAYESAIEEIQVRPISRNPAVRRDLAFLIDKSIPFEKVSGAVVDASGDILEDYWLFDVYEGKGVPEGKHSLAIALQLRKLGANLTDEEANQVREKVFAALGQFGATPR